MIKKKENFKVFCPEVPLRMTSILIIIPYLPIQYVLLVRRCGALFKYQNNEGSHPHGLSAYLSIISLIGAGIVACGWLSCWLLGIDCIHDTAHL